MSQPSPRLRLTALTAGLPDPVLGDFADAFEATFLPASTPLEQIAPDAEVMLLTAGVKLGAAELPRLPPGVKILLTYSSGLDHLDVPAIRERGLLLFNTPDVLGESVADTAMLHLLGAARRVTENIDLIRSRAWQGWSALQFNGVELKGKTLGILGMGGIGRRIAQRARAFGMSIAYHNRNPLADDLAGDAVYYPSFETMLGEIDALMLIAPSTAETRGIIDARRLALAKPGLILVKVARGDLVVDEDLVAALKNGQVWAAGLDVFNNEPKVYPPYFDLPNVFLLPHIGSSTNEARRAMGRVLIDAVAAWREGRRPFNQVV